MEELLIRKLENTVGGMKRRLSLAISLIGDPKVVYMDEPSTGLDPASRNELWNVVMKAKRDRAILLTTHSMEEAEHLCDRLGIFVDGSMQCVGNAKQLKARYGGSYVFTITTPSNYEQEVDSMVRRLFPSANKTYHISGTQKFKLPKHEVRIADVFKQLTMPRTGSRFRHGVLLILLWRMSSSRFHAGSRCSMLHDSYNWQFFFFFLKDEVSLKLACSICGTIWTPFSVVHFIFITLWLPSILWHHPCGMKTADYCHHAHSSTKN